MENASTSQREEETMDESMNYIEIKGNAPQMRIQNLFYKPGCGKDEIEDPLMREFIRPTDDNLLTDWLTLVAQNLIVHGPFVNNFDFKSFNNVKEFADMVKQIVVFFPWQMGVQGHEMNWWYLLGVDLQKHMNVVEAIHFMSENIEVDWLDERHDTVEKKQIGQQYMIAILITTAIVAKMYLVSSPFSRFLNNHLIIQKESRSGFPPISHQLSC